MACPFQIRITRPLSSFRPENPHRPKVGDEGVFLHPREMKKPPSQREYSVEMVVPCGACESCLAARSSQWAVRCYCESLDYDQMAFLTLTYDDEHLPKGGKISKPELQNFLKRLRKKGLKFRYFACGEYGDALGRPHYHAVIFGHDFMGDAIPFNSEHYESKILTEVWGKGIVTTTPATFSTICYTVGYVAKKIGNPDVFQIMSRNPGLGNTYLRKYEADLRSAKAITIEGREYPIPEFFFTKDEGLDDVKQYRKTLSVSKTWEKNRSRGVNAKNKAKRKRGKL